MHGEDSVSERAGKREGGRNSEGEREREVERVLCVCVRVCVGLRER